MNAARTTFTGRELKSMEVYARVDGFGDGRRDRVNAVSLGFYSATEQAYLDGYIRGTNARHKAEGEQSCT